MDWREKINRKPLIFPLRYIWGFPVVKTNPLTEKLGKFGIVFSVLSIIEDVARTYHSTGDHS